MMTPDVAARHREATRQFMVAMTAAQEWRDEQRGKFDGATVEPCRQLAQRYLESLENLQSDLREVERLLDL